MVNAKFETVFENFLLLRLNINKMQWLVGVYISLAEIAVYAD